MLLTYAGPDYAHRFELRFIVRILPRKQELKRVLQPPIPTGGAHGGSRPLLTLISISRRRAQPSASGRCAPYGQKRPAPWRSHATVRRDGARLTFNRPRSINTDTDFPDSLLTRVFVLFPRGGGGRPIDRAIGLGKHEEAGTRHGPDRSG